MRPICLSTLGVLCCLASCLALGQNAVVRQSSHPVFDADGRLAVIIAYGYDSAGVVCLRTVADYDRHGRIEKKFFYTADDLLLVKELYRYDRHGNMTWKKQSFYEDDEEWVNVEERKYDYARDGTVMRVRFFSNGNEYFVSH